MLRRKTGNRLLWILAGECLLGVLLSSASGRAQQADGEPFTVLTRGPVHEALAEQFDGRAKPNLVVPQQPPSKLRELPAEYRPAADGVAWIPGYWAWDDEVEDFLWVSGLWRKAPPNRRWVPGHWIAHEDGFRWISGFWAPIDAQSLRYLPLPPEPREAFRMPVAQRPSPEHFWVPGRWNWVDGDYRWQRGFWARGYDNWTWTPGRYVWTPSGAIYREGYWDYRLTDRGLLFAPIRFRSPVYRQANFVYSPSYALDLVGLPTQLFVRPDYNHYYFGDYFGDRYVQRDIYPWIRFQEDFGRYDPLYNYYRSRTASEGNFLRRVGQWYDYYSANQQFRPPRTLADQRNFADRYGNSPSLLASAVLTSALQELAGTPRGRTFRRLSQEARATSLELAQPLNSLAETRTQQEASGEGAQGKATISLPELTPARREVLKPVIESRSGATGGQPANRRTATGTGKAATNRAKPAGRPTERRQPAQRQRREAKPKESPRAERPQPDASQPDASQADRPQRVQSPTKEVQAEEAQGTSSQGEKPEPEPTPAAANRETEAPEPEQNKPEQGEPKEEPKSGGQA